MLKLLITDDTGLREIHLHAENMKELIDVKIPLFTPMLVDDLPILKKTKRFKSDPEGEEIKERESGWWYDA